MCTRSSYNYKLQFWDEYGCTSAWFLFSVYSSSMLKKSSEIFILLLQNQWVKWKFLSQTDQQFIRSFQTKDPPETEFKVFFYREQNHCFIFLLPLQSVDNWKSAFVCHSDDLINIHMNSIESNLWRCSRWSRSNKVLVQGTKYFPKIGYLISTTQIVA